jgi:recombinational DNA repair protein RecT
VKNPDILECTPESIIDAVATVVQTGLTIGKTVHLVPVKDKGVSKLQAWNDYKGDVELVLRARVARAVYANPVFENEIAQDRFSVQMGTIPEIVHRPFLDATKRGALAGAYGVAVMDAYGRVKIVVWLPLADIEKVRANSRSWKPEKVRDCPEWYAVKTAFHKLCKALPKSEATSRILAIQERQQMQDAETVDAEITDAAPESAAEPAGESYTLRPTGPATADQIARIAQLLDVADITDERRVEIATVAGAKTYTAHAAMLLIAELEQLQPPPSAPPEDFAE